MGGRQPFPAVRVVYGAGWWRRQLEALVQPNVRAEWADAGEARKGERGGKAKKAINYWVTTDEIVWTGEGKERIK